MQQLLGNFDQLNNNAAVFTLLKVSLSKIDR